MPEVTTTLVVQFDIQGGAGSVLTAEIDSRPDGFNGGKTSFTAGDSPVFLVFKTTDVTIQSIVPTTGVIQNLGQGTYAVEQDLIFGDTNSASLDKPITGSFGTSKWLGRSMGSLSLVGQTSVIAAGDPPGVNRVLYGAQFQAYRIANISVPLNGENVFPVVVLITGTTP